MLQRFLVRAREDGVEVDLVYDFRRYSKRDENENFFGRLARMRQQMIDDYLRPHHDDVLWIDADIIDYPADLYDQLRRVSLEGVVSPLVLIEGTELNYDTASFREDLLHRSSQAPPWFSAPGPVVKLLSVGGCVLVPAWVHREQQFHAQSDEDDSWNTEWLSICSYATSKSVPILCDTRIRVQHAHLPKYGEKYH